LRHELSGQPNITQLEIKVLIFIKKTILYISMYYFYTYSSCNFTYFFTVYESNWCVSLNCFAQLWLHRFTCMYCHLDCTDYHRDHPRGRSRTCDIIRAIIHRVRFSIVTGAFWSFRSAAWIFSIFLTGIAFRLRI